MNFPNYKQMTMTIYNFVIPVCYVADCIADDLLVTKDIHL